MSKQAKPRNVATLLNRAKLEFLSSIVFHTVLVGGNMSKQAKPRNVATLLNRAKLEYLSSIVFHTVLVAREYVKNKQYQEMWLHRLIERN